MPVTCCLPLGEGKARTLQAEPSYAAGHLHCSSFSQSSSKGPMTFSLDDCALRRGNKHVARGTLALNWSN